MREGGEERGEDAGVKAMFCSSLSLNSLLHKITANSKSWVGHDTKDIFWKRECNDYPCHRRLFMSVYRLVCLGVDNSS